MDLNVSQEAKKLFHTSHLHFPSVPPERIMASPLLLSSLLSLADSHPVGFWKTQFVCPKKEIILGVWKWFQVDYRQSAQRVESWSSLFILLFKAFMMENTFSSSFCFSSFQEMASGNHFLEGIAVIIYLVIPTRKYSAFFSAKTNIDRWWYPKPSFKYKIKMLNINSQMEYSSCLNTYESESSAIFSRIYSKPFSLGKSFP